MFSNLRQQGGSNHYFLPTSVLQSIYEDDLTSAYSGGVIRIESTNATQITGHFPAELTSILTERTGSLLRTTGHSGRMFNSAVARIVGPFAVPSPSAKAPTYTLPAFEVRRLLEVDLAREPDRWQDGDLPQEAVERLPHCAFLLGLRRRCARRYRSGLRRCRRCHCLLLGARPRVRCELLRGSSKKTSIHGADTLVEYSSTTHQQRHAERPQPRLLQPRRQQQQPAEKW